MSYLKVSFVGAWDGDKSQGYINTDQIFTITQKKGYTLIETSSGRACRIMETAADLVGTIQNANEERGDSTSKDDTTADEMPVKKPRKPRSNKRGES